MSMKLSLAMVNLLIPPKVDPNKKHNTRDYTYA